MEKNKIIRSQHKPSYSSNHQVRTMRLLKIMQKIYCARHQAHQKYMLLSKQRQSERNQKEATQKQPKPKELINTIMTKHNWLIKNRGEEQLKLQLANVIEGEPFNSKHRHHKQQSLNYCFGNTGCRRIKAKNESFKHKQVKI